MKVMVIGGAGYIGSNMVYKLLEKGHQPVVFDNLSTGHEKLIPAGVPFEKGDLRSESDIQRALKKHPVDAVMHFAASSLVGESVQDPLKYYENNVLAMIRLLYVMKASGVNKLIFSSTAAVFGEPKRIPIEEDDAKDPTNPYGQSKLMIEKMLWDYAKISDFRFAALRYFNACGAHPSGKIGEDHTPEMHLIPNILKVLTGEKKELQIFGSDYDTPDGTCIRDYVHVEDLADAHLAALDALVSGAIKSEAFNLGSGSGFSVKEIVNSVQRVTGMKVKTQMCPRRPGDPARLVASSAKANRMLGWKPVYSLDRIIETAWNWEQRKTKAK